MGSSRSIEVASGRPRVLATRPREEAAELAATLVERGFDPIIEPLLEIRFRERPAPDLAGVQAILCTSANGVRALARLSRERALPLLAVGAATAARAGALGFRRVETAGGDVGALVRLVCELARPEAGRLLHIAGSAVAGDLAGDLANHGFAVERAILYDAEPAAALNPATIEALAAGKVDIALFFSPRTAAIFARLVGKAALADRLHGVVSVSISAAADRALGTLEFAAREIAERPDQASLLSALDRIVAARQPA